MKAFEETPECPKCGNEVLRKTYEEAGRWWVGTEWIDKEEHLHCYCTVCKYEWDMYCKDHVGTDCDDEADIQEQLDNTGAMR